MEIIPIPGFSEPVSSWTHLLAAGASAAGLFYLWYRGRGNLSRLFALGVFSFTLIFLFSMSGVYHLLDPAYVPRQVFQRLDHAAIWTLIAGTFTPIHLILFRGVWRWGILALVWCVAITGLVLEVVFFTDIPHWLSLSFYLGLGWMGILTSYHFRRVFQHESIKYIWWGGVFYSIGGLLEFLQWPVLITGVIGPHEIFHIFVIAGAASHWWFVYRWAHYPTRSHLTFHVSVLPGQRYVARALGEWIRLEAGSMEHLRERIREAIANLFVDKTRPKSVRIVYFSEEFL